MSPRIHILPDHVANQIAAGEVVERPGLGREGARRERARLRVRPAIDVSLRNGGKTRDPRGATTGAEWTGRTPARPRSARDEQDPPAPTIWCIASLGFRGEALPSIAAVSRFSLETASEDGVGTGVRAAGGRVQAADEMARRRGTTVTVRGLFGNVPARAKFLRSAAAETRAASEAVVLLALCNLQVGFSLRSNDRELLSLGPSTLRQRIGQIWGEEEASSLIDLDEPESEHRVAGLIQRPDEARTGRRRFTFANGRPFADRGLGRVVDEAYRTTVVAGLRPDYFLLPRPCPPSPWT